MTESTSKSFNQITERFKGNWIKLPLDILKLKGLSISEKIVLCLILSYTLKGMYFHMSNMTISETLNLGSATVCRVMKKLKEEGYIKIKRNRKLVNGVPVITGKYIYPQLEIIQLKLEEYERNSVLIDIDELEDNII